MNPFDDVKDVRNRLDNIAVLVNFEPAISRDAKNTPKEEPSQPPGQRRDLVVRTSRFALHVRRFVRHQPFKRQNAKDQRLQKPKAARGEIEAFGACNYVRENGFENVNPFSDISNISLLCPRSSEREQTNKHMDYVS